ncbi:MAG: SpoIIE family protein phosphatase [Planctomycetaceae bacterium]|nr:SpoIIE family protein phosphatase [Planctomycetaceae bacterium]
MTSGYLHVETELRQSPKRAGSLCGDVFLCERTAAGTTLVCADGIGSGPHAHIAARMCATRLLELLRLGFSLRRAVHLVVETMERWRDISKPYTAFSIARILGNGNATILAYEAPLPLVVGRQRAEPVVSRPLELAGTLVDESQCSLDTTESLLMMTDGITQAGIGSSLPHGWQTGGVAGYVSNCLRQGAGHDEIPDCVHREARRLWTRGGDDCTVALARCRAGIVVNLLTGPPANRQADDEVVARFLQSEGFKVVCGGKTAEVVARHLGKTVRLERAPQSLIAPPRYGIDGIDLVTEGAVTLNQVFNLLDEDIARFKEESGVTELCSLLNVADRVNMTLGTAHNAATDDVAFRQRGILTRSKIVPLLADRLRTAGKLVVVDEV